MTSPPVWDRMYPIIRDGGGSVARAMMVAREYGIPAVSGCIEATKKIKTGARIRVDGNLGVVYILG